MLLTREEAQRCENDALGTCTSASPIYLTGSHDLCETELFRKNKRGIRDHCQVEILTDVMLPAAVSIADGIWAVATQDEMELSKVCENKMTTAMRVIPPPLDHFGFTPWLWCTWANPISTCLLSSRREIRRE